MTVAPSSSKFSLRTVEQVLGDLERRLTRTWASALAGEVCRTAAPAAPAHSEVTQGDVLAEGPVSGLEQGSDWPHAFSLGQVDAVSLERHFALIPEWVATWRGYATRNGLDLKQRARRVHGTTQELPTHVVIPDVDTAARLLDPEWGTRLTRGRRRATRLHDTFSHLAELGLLARTVATIDDFADTDLDLLIAAGQWFAEQDGGGLTPRQVPIEGLHAKWLNTRQHLVKRLANREDLNLAPPHPPRVHFTYLDPAHRSAGHRWHDSVTIGDPMTPAYAPELVIISENKDTAINFPPLARAISVEGVGRGAGAVAAVSWLAQAPLVIYWGDMDADGLEILNEFRAAGIDAVSMFMDLTAYQRWERFGTNTDPQGRPVRRGVRRQVPHLRSDELDLYEALTSADWHRVRRIEQERIPLSEACSMVEKLLGTI